MTTTTPNNESKTMTSQIINRIERLERELEESSSEQYKEQIRQQIKKLERKLGF